MAPTTISPVITRKCDHCNSVSIERIPRSFIIKYLVPIKDLKHYRCDNCMRTFYKIHHY